MPTIAVISHPSHERAARDLCDRLLSSWPGPGEPRFLARTTSELAPLPQTLDACIVLDPTSIPDAAAASLASAARQSHLPCILLADERDPRFAPRDSHEVQTHPARTPPPVLAALLSGLASRQGVVRQMDESLKYAQSVHESVARLVEQFQDEQLLAASIQRQFLSQELPIVPGLACAAFFRPIDFLSGDIYRISRLDEDHVGFFLADAMGHGLPAALMSLYIAGRLTQKEVDADSYRILPPAESITRLNRDLAATGCANVRFATAVCGVINARTREVSLAAAGHPPPLLLDARSVRKVDVGGALLGVMDDSEYEQTTIQLPPDTALLLYSDGLEDSLNPRSPNDEPSKASHARHIEFLQQALIDAGSTDPEALFARLTHSMDADSGSMHQVDDITLVGLRAHQN